jgi:hypothetical protein
MPVTVLTKGERITRSRGLIIGGPNKGKSNLVNKIHDETVLVLSVPGEKGYKTIPQDQDNIEPIILIPDPLPENASALDQYEHSAERYNALLLTSRLILKGEYGAKDILFVDGLSKLYDIIMDVVCKGRYLKGEPFQERGDYTTRLYASAHMLMRQYLTELYDSKLFKLIICTAWERLIEPDPNASVAEAANTVRLGQREWVGAFPGQLGYLVPGEFDWTIRAAYTRPAVCTTCQLAAGQGKHTLAQRDGHLTYQLLPYDDCQCVGLKGMRVPRAATFIHQDWNVLRSFVT